MKSLIRTLFVALFLVGVSTLSVTAQEKSLMYYDSHENEILPDAQVAFRNGKYDRATQLCEWHSTIVGDGRETSLHEKSKRCAGLIKEMKEQLEAGDIKEAKLKASSLLSLNPNDADAKATLLIEEVVPPVQDTAQVTPPLEIIETPVEEEKPQAEANVEEIKETVQPKAEEQTRMAQKIEPEPTPIVVSKKSYNPHTRFVIKAGASVFDLTQLSQTIAPGGAIGLYDLGGSRIGVEIGGYLCPGLSGSSASLFGVDASLVLRAGKVIYPRLGVGFFSCKSTKELCAGAGLTFLLGGHFCLEIGAKYYPSVKVSDTEIVTTAGASYEFPSYSGILSGGIVPEIRVGWAF